MNKEQAIIISDVMKKYNFNMNKYSEFNQKFFNKNDGVLREDNSRLEKGLSVGVYGKNVGQTIDIDIELLPIVIKFFKSLQEYYQQQNENISVDSIINDLKEINE